MGAELFTFNRALDLLISDPFVEYIVLNNKIIIRYDWADNYIDWEVLNNKVNMGEILNGRWEVVFCRYREKN